jgi:hypothetical protein
MSRKASQFQKKIMSLGYRGKEDVSRVPSCLP